MKTRTLIAGTVALLLAAALLRILHTSHGGATAPSAGILPALGIQTAKAETLEPAAPAADQMTAYSSSRGGKIRIEGTANIIHPTWQVESPFIAGMLEVGPGFPTEPGQAVTPGKVQARATNVFVQVRSLKSVESDGKLYSDKMDEIMYEHLKVDKYPAIRYRLTELALKETPKSKDAPYVFDSKGELAVAGVTNTISMPVNVLPLENNKLKITGSVTLKMSDYKVGPVEPKLLGIGIIKTGDDVKILFEWMLTQRRAPGAAATK